MTAVPATPELSRRARVAVLVAAFLALVFDGVELGLMPVVSLSASQDLLGASYTPAAGGAWFARYTAALMLGAAIGGIALGDLGDRIGRTRAMGISVLVYSFFAGLGAFVQTPQQLLALRFVVGLGVGGLWPNAVSLVSECWINTSRPVVAGVLGAGINVGILVLSQVTQIWPMTPQSWRWIFWWAALPGILGVSVLAALPESPLWKSAQHADHKPSSPVRELFRPDLLRVTIVAILLSSVPLLGAWAGSKWMIPWADQVGGTARPNYKSVTQGWWALGATLGSFLGAPVAKVLGRRLAYFLMSLGTALITWVLFQWTAPLAPSFLPIVFAQGVVGTMFFGWLPLCLPELFPLRVRAAGSGLAMNSGRFATAAGVLAAGSLFAAFGGSYPTIGGVCALLYAAGMVVVCWAPDTGGQLTEE